jgi:hypothetical protein
MKSCRQGSCCLDFHQAGIFVSNQQLKPAYPRLSTLLSTPIVGKQRRKSEQGLWRRVTRVEFSFFFGSQCVHEKNAVAPARFGMAAMRTDQLGRFIGTRLYSIELIYLKRAPALGIRTSLKLHDLQ